VPRVLSNAHIPLGRAGIVSRRKRHFRSQTGYCAEEQSADG